MKVTLELKDKYPVTPNRIREIIIREILSRNRDSTENQITIGEGVQIIGVQLDLLGTSKINASESSKDVEK